MEEKRTCKEAIILAGGDAWRLKPHTYTPKPMLKIGKFTLLEHQISWLFRHDFEHIVIASREVYPLIYNEKHGVEFSIETEKLGTGGAIKNAFKLIKSDRAYVMNVDDIILYDPNILWMSCDRGAAVIVAKPRIGLGVVKLRQNLVIDFKQKPIVNFYVNAGHYCFKKHIVNTYFPNIGDFEPTVLPRLARERKLTAVRLKNTWRTINTYKDYQQVLKEAEVLFYNMRK